MHACIYACVSKGRGFVTRRISKEGPRKVIVSSSPYQYLSKAIFSVDFPFLQHHIKGPITFPFKDSPIAQMAHLSNDDSRDHFAEVLNARMEARIDRILNGVMGAAGFAKTVQNRMQAALQDAFVSKLEKHIDDEMAGPRFKDNFKRQMYGVLNDAWRSR